MQTETQVAIVTSLVAGASLAWWWANKNNSARDDQLYAKTL